MFLKDRFLLIVSGKRKNKAVIGQLKENRTLKSSLSYLKEHLK